MKPFIHDDFLLSTDTAKKLYHEYAANQPILDYHCHISPQEIAENKQFRNLTELWLAGDHYKWRAMRTNGISEDAITGDLSDWDKFYNWAITVPYTLRNPLYHWTHIELKRVFGIDKLLNKDTAKEIWDTCNEILQRPDFTCQGLIRKANVQLICTTDDPIDSLEYHQQIKDSGFEVLVLPAWRADKVLAIENLGPFNEYLDKLAEVASVGISSYESMMQALQNRHDFFAEMGCKLSDHGLDKFFSQKYTAEEVDVIFEKARNGQPISKEEADKYKSSVLYDLAVMDYSKGWTQQFHVGAIRNNNSFMEEQIGPDTGYDSIGDELVAQDMSNFLNGLQSEDKLCKTILYNLNPAHNEVYATMIGNFQDGKTPGKIQWGSGWWFLDQKDGMEKQMNALSNLGLLSRFVGMLTDSRSFLSYSRHEYFRRVLCNLLGNDVENGLVPNDEKLLGEMIENICYYNAKEYFGFFD
ncbi:glucuronate isomerase [Reichenbachiella versicolor]|uniref:glucuronate isomerase n=1 Tax=Reichenbachiella versicolor TaxID=1821036 RepID=UPI000D6E7CC1|nr:glucuronate isomerase [Reichenbachiella versicolor]